MQQRGQEIACRLATGPDLGGNPSGKIIVEEAQRLARDMDMALPAHQIEEIQHHDLFFNQRAQRDHRKSHEDDNGGNAQQFKPMRTEQPLPACGFGDGIDQIHQPPDKPEHAGFHDRHRAAKQRHGKKCPLGLAHVKPHERRGACRRTQIRTLGKGIDPAFEQADDGGNQHGAGPHGYSRDESALPAS